MSGLFRDSYQSAIMGRFDEQGTITGAGFGESVRLGFDLFQQEDKSNSALQNWRAKETERDAKALEVAGVDLAGMRRGIRGLQSRPNALLSGRRDEAEDQYRRTVEALSRQYTEVLSDDELMVAIAEESAVLREKTAARLKHGSMLGSFVGTMGSAITDPVVAGSMLLGAPARAGLVAKAAIEAAIGVASEIPIQGIVRKYKEQIDSPYTTADVLTNIAAAGVGGAVLTGGLILTGRGAVRVQAITQVALERHRALQPLRNRIAALEKVPNRNLAEEDALEILRDQYEIEASNPFNTRSLADTTAHREATTRAVAQLHENLPVDVEDLTAGRVGIEPIQSDDITRHILEPGKTKLEEPAPAIRLEDGTVLYDADAAAFSDVPLRLGIPLSRVADGGYVTKDGHFVERLLTEGEEAALVKRRQGKAAEVGQARQTLSGFVKSEGGVSLEKSGAVRGEFAATRESGPGSRDVVKLKAGESADIMAQKAHAEGFIDSPDPEALARALRKDLGGERIYRGSAAGAQRRIELEVEKEWADMIAMAEEDLIARSGRDVAEREAGQVSEIERMQEDAGLLTVNDFEQLYTRTRAAYGDDVLDGVEVAVGVELDEGALGVKLESAEELMQELEADEAAGRVLQKCLVGGAGGA